MKKNLFNTISLALFTVFLFVSCQKEIKESPAINTSKDGAVTLETANKEEKNSCRLVSLDWSAGGAGLWQFHYNEKGLADQWKIDYGYGVIEEKMYYDKNNLLIKADEIYFGSNYVYQFYYTGKRLTRITTTGVDFPGDVKDFRLTYNKKGQNIRQDEDNLDTHVVMEYDHMGNCIRTDIYFGSDLYYSDNYTFEKPIKNPMLNVPGIEIGFLAYGGTYVSNKRWFTTNRTVIYDNGVPFIFNDYDPSKTVPNTGGHNLPNSVNYYDRVSEGSINITFGYDNCGGRSDKEDHRYSQGNRNIGTNKTAGYTGPLLFRGSAKSIKEQIQKLRQQFKTFKN